MTANQNAIRGGGRFDQNTRFRAVTRPTIADKYPQRIHIYDLIADAGTVARNELFAALIRANHTRRNGAAVNLQYCRAELRDMYNRGHIDLA